MTRAMGLQPAIRGGEEAMGRESPDTKRAFHNFGFRPSWDCSRYVAAPVTVGVGSASRFQKAWLLNEAAETPCATTSLHRLCSMAALAPSTAGVPGPFSRTLVIFIYSYIL